jgi:methanethiol S-methyltransferase
VDAVRYSLGVLTVVAVPAGLVYWLLIHSLARQWRRWGAVRTYLLVLPALIAFGALLFHTRRDLLGRDLGTSWTLIAVALVLCCPIMWLELRYWRQLKLSVLVGIPEVSNSAPSRLLRDGIYGTVRHPRYLSAGIGLLVNALIANYTGVYVLLLAVLPPGILMLRLEERELVQRFGDDYRAYQRQVPQMIPRLSRRRH